MFHAAAIINYKINKYWIYLINRRHNFSDD
jgi:hypothetical protein